MRKPLIAGNWKMHGSVGRVEKLIDGIKQGMAFTAGIEVLVCPPFVYLIEAAKLLHDTGIALGAQNLYLGEQGPFTGEVSGTMLADAGCEYVLIGHSERRTIFNESDALIAGKFNSALDAGLKPILCIGETQAQREANLTNDVLREQLESVIDIVGIDGFRHAVLAYEPVWAIGTGLTATPALAQEAHAYIRQIIAQNNVAIADTIRILYGGSMKAENAAALLAMPDIDGGLIGGASLDAHSFLKICQAASQCFMDAAKTG